jgi:hypothetical protein
MKKIYENKIFIICSIIVLLGLVTVFAEEIIIDVEGITSSKGHTGITMNMTIITDAGEKWFMVYEDGILVNTTELIPELTDGLVSYYSLDETSGAVIDLHGSNNGTNNGATTNVTGQIETAYDFDGSNDGIDLPNGSDTLEPSTISFWMKTNSTNDNVLMQFVDNSNTKNYYFRINMAGSSNKFRAVYYNGVSDTILTSSSDVNDGLWKHIVVTRDDTNAEIFINGVSDVSTSTYTNGDVGGDIRTIGYFGLSDILYFDGKIDEVGIWNRTLTADDISDLYNFGNGLAYSEF